MNVRLLPALKFYNITSPNFPLFERFFLLLILEVAPSKLVIYTCTLRPDDKIHKQRGGNRVGRRCNVDLRGKETASNTLFSSCSCSFSLRNDPGPILAVFQDKRQPQISSQLVNHCTVRVCVCNVSLCIVYTHVCIYMYIQLCITCYIYRHF